MHLFSPRRGRAARRSAAMAALLLALAPAVGAQPPSARPDPLDPTAAVPPTVYRSPLAGYRALRDQPVGSWREANDTVGRIGGWRAYAREVARGEADEAAGPAASPAPAAAPGTSPGTSTSISTGSTPAVATPSLTAPRPVPTAPPAGQGHHGRH